ncbi:MAG TPA: FAD-dependent oxidoreductase [Solirubrobacteraceae bacterium]|nr:FAD-dependent oxidoreductase [Solirubrobacteraceae bacterium]
MTNEAPTSEKFRVVVAGGGVAALETVLALHDLAGDRVAVTVLAPDEEFVYRPMTVREPFAYSRADRFELAPIVQDAGATLHRGKLAWVEPKDKVVVTEDDERLEYDALVVALGAKIYPRYKHAVTIDDRRMDEALHGLIQDIEGGYLKSVAFVAPGRMAWPLPLYELALMAAGRAYDSNLPLEVTIVTPETGPLAVFGQTVSDGVSALLSAKGIRTITDAYAEIPEQGSIVINPGDRRLHAQRVVALPELYGPSVRGLPVSEHGFLRVDRFCRVADVEGVYAAGDSVDFPVKQGGVGSQQADAVAESIAALAGAEIEPQPFDPDINGVLLTDEKPRYIHAKITGGHGFASEFSETPIGEATEKITTRYLTHRLQQLDATEVRT